MDSIFLRRTKFNELTDDQLFHSITKFIRNDIVIVEFSTEHDRTPAIASHCHSFLIPSDFGNTVKELVIS
jgi:hypothetical protein